MATLGPKPQSLARARARADNRRVVVCDACLTVGCWHGLDMCWGSRSAGIATRTVAELDALGREHPSRYRSRWARAGEG